MQLSRKKKTGHNLSSPTLAVEMAFNFFFSMMNMVVLSVTSLLRNVCAHKRNMAPLIKGQKKGELISNIEILGWEEEGISNGMLVSQGATRGQA